MKTHHWCGNSLEYWIRNRTESAIQPLKKLTHPGDLFPNLWSFGSCCKHRLIESFQLISKSLKEIIQTITVQCHFMRSFFMNSVFRMFQIWPSLTSSSLETHVGVRIGIWRQTILRYCYYFFHRHYWYLRSFLIQRLSLPFKLYLWKWPLTVTDHPFSISRIVVIIFVDLLPSNKRNC